MFGNLGFSYTGLIFLLMLFIPNIIWSHHIPDGYDTSGENRILLMFERAGQVCVTCTALIFSNFNPVTLSAWSLWFAVSCICMILYELCWIRYFTGKKVLTDFYRSFLGIPVPLASLPVMAFLLLGIYGKVIWLIISSVIIGIGHIGIHIQHLKSLKEH